MEAPVPQKDTSASMKGLVNRLRNYYELLKLHLKHYHMSRAQCRHRTSSLHLQEYVHDWFDLRGMEESPYMMYAVNCRDGVSEKIPAIIHVDGTCRIQTVNQSQNENYYNIIKAFHSRTGIPIIFNTSFNLGGEPLVETLEDAVRTLQNSKIEYLYLPEYKKLIHVPN
jgi:carbamoyltransferase